MIGGYSRRQFAEIRSKAPNEPVMCSTACSLKSVASAAQQGTRTAFGRRYRRQDEIGTPYAVTVDFDSLEDRQVTVRERDTTKQDRIAIDQL